MYYCFLFPETTELSVFESESSTYQIIKKKVVWFDAQAHCYAIGGHLAAFETEEEFSSISTHIPLAVGGYHFGLNDLKEEGKRTWEHSGQEVGAYQAWAPNEPSNYPNEDCGSMTPYGWYDVPCPSHHVYYFICEFAKE